jgi:hypothetical protein
MVATTIGAFASLLAAAAALVAALRNGRKVDMVQGTVNGKLTALQDGIEAVRLERDQFKEARDLRLGGRRKADPPSESGIQASTPGQGGQTP